MINVFDGIQRIAYRIADAIDPSREIDDARGRDNLRKNDVHLLPTLVDILSILETDISVPRNGGREIRRKDLFDRFFDPLGFADEKIVQYAAQNLRAILFSRVIRAIRRLRDVDQIFETRRIHSFISFVPDTLKNANPL